MTEFLSENERIKRRYGHYLKEACGRAESTIKQALYAIARFERWSGFRSFKRFNSAQAIGYRKHLLGRGGRQRAELSARATVHSALVHLRRFFQWLALEPGFRKSIDARQADFFNLSARDVRIAVSRPEKPTPTVEQMLAVLRAMPHATDVQKRDRALIALMLLTGVRVKALTTLKLRHVRPDRLGINQDAREVETKGAKSFPTFFFPVSHEATSVFLSYVDHLRMNLLFSDGDPLFPSTRQDINEERQFEVAGLTRSHWATTDPVRSIMRKACARAGIPYYSPHSLRRTLAIYGERHCKTPEEFKAWSQNMGHSQVLTTFTSYGAVSQTRQAELIQGISANSCELPNTDVLNQLAQQLAAILIAPQP